jgi:hypothetical protein
VIRPISIFLLVVGLLWGFFVSGLIALLGGFFGNTPPSDPIVIGKGVLSIWWMFAGPLLLVGGTICVLRVAYARVGAISALVGCAILTIMVGYQTVSMLRHTSDPLVMRPQYSFYALAVILTLFSDAGAVRLYQVISTASTKNHLL